MKRPEDAGFTGTNKASTIGNKAFHRIRDALMVVSAGIDAIVSGKASHVRDARHGRKA